MCLITSGPCLAPSQHCPAYVCVGWAEAQSELWCPSEGEGVLWEQTQCVGVVNASLRGPGKEKNTSLEHWQHLNPLTSLSCCTVTVLGGIISPF